MVEPPGIAPGLSVFQTVLRTSYNKTPLKLAPLHGIAPCSPA